MNCPLLTESKLFPNLPVSSYVWLTWMKTTFLTGDGAIASSRSLKWNGLQMPLRSADGQG